MTDFVAHKILTDPQPGISDTISLTYEARFLRRKVLSSRNGIDFLVDLAQTTSLNHGDSFQLNDGRIIAIEAAPEALLNIRGPDLVRLAWHIGNRHMPCQILPDCLRIQDNHVMTDMLSHLGADFAPCEAPFTPEGGAYGHGRTHGHSH